MTYGVEALPLLREEVEDCPATKANLVLIDEFCELNEKNYKFVCYVKLYFTTEEIIVARRKIWKAQAPAFTFSRVHKIKDIVFEKEAYLTDIITVVDSTKDQKFYYQIHFSGDVKQWFIAFERYSKWHQNKNKEQNAITSAAAADNCNRVKTLNGARSRVPSVVLWNRADFQCLNSSARSNSVSSSQDLSSHLVTPVRSNRLSNPLCKETFLSGEEDVSSSPELQESSGIDLDNISMHEEGDTNKEQAEKTFTSTLEAWTTSSDDFVTASSLSSEPQLVPDDDKIRTLDTAVCNKGHTRNKSTSLTRGVQIMTRSNSTISSAMSDPGVGPRVDSGTTVQSGLAYTNIPAILKSISYDYQSHNSFLSSPLRHTQIRGKKVKFSPRQKMFSTLPGNDGEECLIFENDTQDDSFCSITLENSTPSEDSITPRPVTPTRSFQTKGASLAVHSLPFTAPKRKLVARLFRRRTTSSISDVDDGSHLEMESPETFRPMKKKLHQLDPKVVASQLVLLDAEMLRKIKPDELKGGAWVGKNKETRAPNVMKMVQEFNRLALLVPTEILEEKTASARAKVIACYIQIADKCRNFGNYNSLKAILAGLQCTPIYRLKKTWKEVSGRRKKKFEDLSHLMSEEDNWKVYKMELYDLMAKGTCVPFLGQFLTQILQQETVNEVKSYRRKSYGRRPQSGELSSDNRETLSAPTTPVNSDNEELNLSALSPTDLNYEQKNSSSNMYPDASHEETKNGEEDELKDEATKDEDNIKKEISCCSIVERSDTLFPLPIGKFKKNHLPPINLYKESFKKFSQLQADLNSPESKDTVDEDDKMVENGSTAPGGLRGAECGIDKVVKTLSLESLDSYDAASSCYSRGSTPPRDVSNIPDSEPEDGYHDIPTTLDTSQIELSIEDSLDTPTSDFDKEYSPFVDQFETTEDNAITTDINPVQTTSNEVTTLQVKAANVEGKISPVADRIRKRRWNSLKKKTPPPVGSSDNAPNKKENNSFRRKLSSPTRSVSNPNCISDTTPKKENKRSLRRKLSSPTRGHNNTNCNDEPPQRREKLHIFDLYGFNAHTMLQKMQFSSLGYMKSLFVRPEVQSFIKGLQYNSEEDNYHISIQTEPIEHSYQ